MILQLSTLYGEYSPPFEWSMSLQFDDSIAEDRATEITAQTMLLGAGMTYKHRAINENHGVTWQRQRKILKEIQSENPSRHARDYRHDGD